MIREVRNRLISDIRTALPNIELVDKYRGEFAEGSDWNPRSSACFIQVISMKPLAKSPDGSILRSQIIFKIYAGSLYTVDDTVYSDALDVVEALLTFIDSNVLTVNNFKFEMETGDEGMDLFVVERRFESYAFNLLIS